MKWEKTGREVHVPIVEVKYCWNCGARMEG